MKTSKVDKRLLTIFIMSLVATLGSLYYSNFGDPVINLQSGQLFHSGNGLDPCHLCWWARILMYPIVFISGFALLDNNRKALRPIMALSVLGTGLEIYHYVLQKFDIATTQMCTQANPCAALKVDYFGFITIPFLCLTAFVVILIAATTRRDV